MEYSVLLWAGLVARAWKQFLFPHVSAEKPAVDEAPVYDIEDGKLWPGYL